MVKIIIMVKITFKTINRIAQKYVKNNNNKAKKDVENYNNNTKTM